MSFAIRLMESITPDRGTLDHLFEIGLGAEASIHTAPSNKQKITKHLRCLPEININSLACFPGDFEGDRATELVMLGAYDAAPA